MNKLLLHPAAKPLLFALALIPFAHLLYGALANTLGANPAEALIRGSGDWVLRFLCITLAITPLREWSGWSALARLRRMTGLFAYFYGVTHFLCYAWLDMNLSLGDIIRDIPKRPFILVGTLAMLLMTPLAATSFNRAIKTLGAKRWKTLHKLVYAIVLLGLLHFFWMRAAKHNFAEWSVYAVVVAALLGWRLWRAWRARVGRGAGAVARAVAAAPGTAAAAKNTLACGGMGGPVMVAARALGGGPCCTIPQPKKTAAPTGDGPNDMQRTIFTTPGVNSVLRAMSLAFLRLTGWTLTGALPAAHPKCVLIAAPHTSNWDLPYTLMVAFALRANIRWMGKQALFRWPFGPLMRWLGGIAVNRSQSGNLVAASARALREADGAVQLVVPPEGTRAKTRHWKTGFYWIAHQAGVPIVLAYMDYPRKQSGLGPLFQPSGDVEADMAQIKAWYAQWHGKNSDQFDNG